MLTLLLLNYQTMSESHNKGTDVCSLRSKLIGLRTFKASGWFSMVGVSAWGSLHCPDTFYGAFLQYQHTWLAGANVSEMTLYHMGSETIATCTQMRRAL